MARSAPASLSKRLRARPANRVEQRDEQILVRDVIAVVIVVGLMIAALGEPPPPQVGAPPLIAGSYLLGALLPLAHLLYDRGRSRSAATSGRRSTWRR